MVNVLDTVDAAHRAQFDEVMHLLDLNYAPPLLWGSPKLSSWYAVGLLARQQGTDIEVANKLLANGLTQQDLDPEFDRNWGSFKEFMSQPNASGPKPLWAAKIYESYDPNNALFFTLACIIIDALYSDLIDKALLDKLHKAMHECCIGNALREGGRYGDDMRPSYSNPFMMRCVCSAYVGHLRGDQKLLDQSDAWMAEATSLWETYDSPGEFNSPTYAGITMLAMGFAQFCPPTSTVYKDTPKLLTSLWRSLGELYNPTLGNLAGPWDRSYGFCMSQYFACIGTPIAALIPADDIQPYPKALAGASHFDDMAVVPMQILLSKYVESALPAGVVDKLHTLTPHSHFAQSYFPPHEHRPRKFSFWIGDGLNIGGCDYDNDQLGGPKGEQDQFCPGVIQWDSGKHGAGSGWISVYPTSSSAAIVADSESLSISLPPSSYSLPPAETIILDVGALPFLQLNGASFKGKRESLPGLDVEFSGNVADSMTIEFNKHTQRWGMWFYRLTFKIDPELRRTGQVPRLIVHVKKTTPPEYPFRM